MQINITTDYAIRIVYFLATKTNGPATSTELSKSLAIPKSIVLKLCKKLSIHEIVRIHPGSMGGYTIRKHPEDIRLFDILNIFEPTTKLNRCLEDEQYCSRYSCDVCPVRKFYVGLQKVFEESLQAVSILDFANGTVPNLRVVESRT